MCWKPTRRSLFGVSRCVGYGWCMTSKLDDLLDTRIAITVSEAAEMLGVSKPHLYKCMNDGEVPSLRVGKKRLVPVSYLRDVAAGAV